MTQKANLPSRKEALDWAKQQLCNSESSSVDSQLLLSFVIGVNHAGLVAWPEKTLAPQHWQALQRLIARRREGEPVAYIIGEQGFWNLTLSTNPSTLIPRPETELLVAVVLSLPLPDHSHCLDLGTGTGAIALALASERPHWQILGIDIEPEAVVLAKQNAQRNRLSNVHGKVTFAQGNWASQLDSSWHCIVSNPPYIDAQDQHLNQGDVRFEPRSALVSPQQGLADINQICQQAMTKLQEHGWLVVEHGYNQGQQVRDIFSASGFKQVQTKLDLGRRERATFGRKVGLVKLG